MSGPLIYALTRRQVLAALAVVPIKNDISKAGGFQGWLQAQAQISNSILLDRESEPLEISGNVVIPSSTSVTIKRDLKGINNATLRMSSDSSLIFDGAKSENVAINIAGGKRIKVEGFKYSGGEHLAAITIDGDQTADNIVIGNFEISDANFGILRQGAKAALSRCRVFNGIFRNLRGDAIEWNICPNDRDILVEEIDIDGINDPISRPFWGIGIGFAGGTYDQNWDREKMVNSFVIRNIRGKSLRQLIHVEDGANFLIENVHGNDIGNPYAERSGLEAALIACYGCSDFAVNGIKGQGNILLYAGILKGHYICPCSNFKVEDVELSAGDIRADIGGRTSKVEINNITLKNGSVVLHGEANVLRLADLSIKSSSPDQAPMVFDPSFLDGELASFKPLDAKVYKTHLKLTRGP